MKPAQCSGRLWGLAPSALLLAAWVGAASAALPVQPLERIAFGSCNRADRPQPLWAPILAVQPDLWIWTGDIIYADTTDMQRMAEGYARQKAESGYVALRRTVPVMGIWDDHDYGRNDAGAEYPQKKQSAKLLLDFLDEPDDSPRRQQEGLYTARVFGPTGRRVRVLLLDTRYHREPPGVGADPLGTEQWNWLAQQLESAAHEFVVLVSSIQVLNEANPYESWGRYPRARARLLKMIESSAALGLVLVTGDRHFAEIARWGSAQLRYPLIEVTASGLTHSWKDFPGEPNPYRSGPVYTGLNFGVLRFQWQGQGVELAVEVRDRSGAAVHQVAQWYPSTGLENADASR